MTLPFSHSPIINQADLKEADAPELGLDEQKPDTRPAWWGNPAWDQPKESE